MAISNATSIYTSLTDVTKQDARFRYSTGRHQLPRKRFSRVPSMFDSLGVKVPYPT